MAIVRCAEGARGGVSATLEGVTVLGAGLSVGVHLCVDDVWVFSLGDAMERSEQCLASDVPPSEVVGVHVLYRRRVRDGWVYVWLLAMLLLSVLWLAIAWAAQR